MSLPQLRMEKNDLDNVPEIPIPPGYLLRTYRPGDEAGIAEVYAAAELGTSTAEAVKERIVGREYFRPQRLFVVERDDRVVGTAAAWEEAADPPVGYLHMVGVIPSERGKKLGAALTVAAIQQNCREGFALQRLDTDDFREAALRLYLDLGYYPLLTHESHASRWEAVGLNLGRPDVLQRARRVIRQEIQT